VFRRSIFIVILLLAGGAMAPQLPGATIAVQLFPYTGEIRLGNPSAQPLPFVYYSLSSDGGALDGDPEAWKSITSTYDAPNPPTPGNGFIDPTHGWTEISSTSMELTEGAFTGPGGVLPPFRAISLGNIWDPDAVPVPDIVAQVVQADEQDATILLQLAIDGNYNGDNMVDDLDYQLWQAAYGASGSIFSYWADGNLDGIVDSADYTIWRNNLGLTVPTFAGFGEGPTALSIAASAVPEPGAALLATLAAVLALACYRSRSSTAWCTA
jgi:hypothetical protein